MQVKAHCITQLRVKPGDPESSVLVEKMSGASCGQRMPADNPLYFDGAAAQLDLVRSWITLGALNN